MPSVEETLRCTTSSLDQGGLYLIYCPLALLLWVGNRVPPQTLLQLFDTNSFSSLTSGKVRQGHADARLHLSNCILKFNPPFSTTRSSLSFDAHPQGALGLYVSDLTYVLCLCRLSCLFSRTSSLSAPEISYALCNPRQLLLCRWTSHTSHFHNVVNRVNRILALTWFRLKHVKLLWIFLCFLLHTQLKMVKEGDSCEESLQRLLVEDKSPNGGASYADFLFHLHVNSLRLIV